MTKKHYKCKIRVGDFMKGENKRKMSKVILGNIVIFLAVTTIILFLILIYNTYILKNKVYAIETVLEVKTGNLKISKANKIDVNEVINQKKNKKEEYILKEETLEYITTYRDNASLPKGQIQVKQEGREGKQEVTIKKIYENDKLILEEEVNYKITKAAINKIVEVGTGSGKYKYKAKIGDIIYVTSDRLEVKQEPNIDSQKVTTLAEKASMKIIEIQEEWYKVLAKNKTGYVKKENTTYINKKENIQNNYETENDVAIKPNISYNMQLNKPSGLSFEQFEKILTDNKDKNNVFKENYKYFYYIENQYNINGLFVAAVAIHESGWGTSKISLDKNNLFGYGAYDSTPYNSAYNFKNYSERNV